MRPLLFLPLFLLSLTTGCATYNYDIVQPDSARMRIADDWRHLPAGPVTYRFRSYENHLVIHVYNSTPDPLRLLGDRSYIVTPDKQSIPLATQTIAPGAYLKLILPPVQRVIPTGPSIGFGAGYSTGRAYHPHPYPPFYEPTYLYVENPATYWEWDDESDATLHLTFQQHTQTFDQTFIFHRAKV